MEDHIDGLRAARRRLREEEIRLRRAGASLDKAIRMLEAVSQQSGARPGESPTGLRTVPSFDLGGLTQREAAKIVLTKSARSMTVREILGEFEKAGRQPRAKNGYRSLYKQLREDPRFQSTEGRWRFVEQVGARQESMTVSEAAAAV